MKCKLQTGNEDATVIMHLACRRTGRPKADLAVCTVHYVKVLGELQAGRRRCPDADCIGTLYLASETGL